MKTKRMTELKRATVKCHGKFIDDGTKQVI